VTCLEPKADNFLPLIIFATENSVGSKPTTKFPFLSVAITSIRTIRVADRIVAAGMSANCV
jgi:hypothetical protein